MTKLSSIEEAKRLMGALLRMPPKPHSEMKLYKRRKRVRNPAKKQRAASASAKNV